MVFTPKHTDYVLSPYTGLTRESWIEAAKYLLTGIFRNLRTADDPLLVPRYEDRVTYPNAQSPEWKKQAEIFEGLARSFFAAAPLIHIEPELELCGFKLRDYYRTQILRICTPGDPLYVYSLTELKELDGQDSEFPVFQQTVESCALVICLWVCRDEIWNTYSTEEKERIAALIRDYAMGDTLPHNWRLFNMLDLAFLNMEGYEIDRDVMREHAQAILGYYAGDGWYRDGHTFDYYCSWAFQTYLPLWNQWYGYENEPYLAKRFEDNSNRLMENFPFFFDRDGFTNMWGRSGIYRNAAACALEGNLLLRNPAIDPGLARRILSGSLMQFLGREDFLYEGVPSPGFYGPFLPLIQGYSCAESPFWLAKVFLCLHLPADHPFWTQTERNGCWESLQRDEVFVRTMDGPALCVADHGANGTTELRTGKVTKRIGDKNGMWNYVRLAYSTKYPWEAAPCEDVEAQQYALRDALGKIRKCNAVFWCGSRDEVLYRRAFFDYDSGKGCHRMTAVNLADFVVPCGLIRVDKVRYVKRPATLTLGAYGFPDNGTQIIRKRKDGAEAVILKGHDRTGKEKQLAMTVFAGWERLDIVRSCGTNPDSARSIVIYASCRSKEMYGYGPYLFISQVITKESLEDFQEEELFPIRRIRYTDPQEQGGYGPVTVELAQGERVIDFDGIEGMLQL